MLTRRTFLVTTATALSVRPSFGQRSPERLLLAAETGLLERTAGCDVVAQIERAADLGFAAFGDSEWFRRAPVEQDRIADAISNRGMTLAPVPGLMLSAGHHNLAAMTHPLVSSVRLAVGPNELHRDTESRLTAHWTVMAAAATEHGLTLLVESWDDGRCGGAQFTRCADLVQRVSRPGLRLSVDAGQLWRAGMSVRDFCRQYATRIGHVELPAMSVDQRQDAVLGLRTLWRAGFRGVVGLRQGLNGPVEATERQLVALRQHLEHDVAGEHLLTRDEL